MVCPILDTFADPDGTLLTAHIPDVDVPGGGWSILRGAAGGFAINTNQLLLNLNSSPYSGARIDTGIAEYILTVTVTIGGNNPFLFIRMQDISNLIAINPSNSANALRVFRVVGGAFTSIASTPFAYAAGNVIDVQVTLSGDLITVDDLTNSIQVSATEASFAGDTRVGVGEDTGASACRFDDLQVCPLP